MSIAFPSQISGSASLPTHIAFPDLKSLTRSAPPSAFIGGKSCDLLKLCPSSYNESPRRGGVIMPSGDKGDSERRRSPFLAPCVHAKRQVASIESGLAWRKGNFSEDIYLFDRGYFTFSFAEVKYQRLCDTFHHDVLPRQNITKSTNRWHAGVSLPLSKPIIGSRSFNHPMVNRARRS